MAFSAPQVRKLRKNVRPQFIKERHLDGKILPYVEAWHVIAEANRVFGHEGWDRETVSTQCTWQKQVNGQYGAAYVARVRITVRAEGSTVVREGFGAGEAFSLTPGQAHERAIKTAETDATKRALSTFGSCFGLALYQNKAPAAIAPNGDNGPEDEAGLVEEPFVPANSDNGTDVDIAAANRKAITQPPVSDDQAQAANSEPLGTIGAFRPEPITRTYLNGRGEIIPRPVSAPAIEDLSPIDKSELTLGEPKRYRSTEHLRFVATKPCLVCGRLPSDAHHLRFTQPRAMGKKVSDEYTVPLCRFHHDEAHRAGNELSWWKARGIEPMAIAGDLWMSSRKGEAAQMRARSSNEEPSGLTKASSK